MNQKALLDQLQERYDQKISDLQLQYDQLVEEKELELELEFNETVEKYQQNTLNKVRREIFAESDKNIVNYRLKRDTIKENSFENVIEAVKSRINDLLERDEQFRYRFYKIIIDDLLSRYNQIDQIIGPPNAHEILSKILEYEKIIVTDEEMFGLVALVNNKKLIYNLDSMVSNNKEALRNIIFELFVPKIEVD
jgi:hypothetical protein